MNTHFVRLKRGLLALALVALVALPAAAQADHRLRAKLADVVEDRIDLAEASLGVHVRDALTGESIYTIRGDVPLLPASNMKLLTTGAAALVLGPDMVFVTSLKRLGDDLVIVGSGDPALGDPALLAESDPPSNADDLLDLLAGAAVSRGLRRVDEIIVDDRVFDRELIHPTWPKDQLNRWYCAEVSGLNFHTNCLTFYFTPAVAGRPAQAAAAPAITPGAEWLSIESGAVTAQTGMNTVWIARPNPENRFMLRGAVRSPASVDVAVHEPGLVMAHLLAERLIKAGASLPRSAAGAPRLALADEPLAAAETLAEIRTALPDILRRANVNSQNLFTEALIKRIGHQVTGEPGSWANGAAVIRLLIAERLGPDVASTVSIADGSGLSRDNRIPAQALTAWLASVYRDPTAGPMLVESLPQIGEGTLRNRFERRAIANRVLAKSGSIDGVRTLSGLVISPHSRRAIAFSVLANGLDDGRATRAARELHEEVAAAIDQWLTETDAELARIPAGSRTGLGG